MTKIDLEDYGWDAEWEAELHRARHTYPNAEPGRIVRVDRLGYRAITCDGEFAVYLPGRLVHRSDTRGELPSVGDWVLLEPSSEQYDKVIRLLLSRRSQFIRKRAGKTNEEQVIAANVDTVFIIMGLDHDFNLNRLHRYVTLAKSGQITPIVLLNKADLAPHPDEQKQFVERELTDIATYLISAKLSQGLDVLQRYLARQKTVALIGSSGVGKSTLVNLLLGEHRMKTSLVRDSDHRGKHTTTHRELFLLPEGGVLIDTPGLRELQLWGEESSLKESFPDIDALAVNCRFRNCNHEHEPDCAVQTAVATSTLTVERFESFRKLQQEYEQLAKRQQASAPRLKTSTGAGRFPHGTRRKRSTR